MTILDPSALWLKGSPLTRWLERLQARRSSLLLAPDRATGVAFARRWRLDLSRMRLIEDTPSPELLTEWLALREHLRRRRWYAG